MSPHSAESERAPTAERVNCMCKSQSGCQVTPLKRGFIGLLIGLGLMTTFLSTTHDQQSLVCKGLNWLIAAQDVSGMWGTDCFPSAKCEPIVGSC